MYTNTALTVQCANCYLGLQSAALYLNLVADPVNGFQSAACEADISLVAGLGFTAQVAQSGSSYWSHNITQQLVLLGGTLSVAALTVTPQVTLQLFAVSNLTAGGGVQVATGDQMYVAVIVEQGLLAFSVQANSCRQGVCNNVD